jgi:penicillin-binding protein 2
LQALAQSSDIFFYEIMGGFQNLTNMGFTSFTSPYGIERLATDYKNFGLGSLTGIDIPGESPGRVPTPEWQKSYSGQPWYTGETYNTSVGQGDLLVSPLQMVMALSAIGNGGTLYKPHFVDKIVGPDGKLVEQVKPDVVRNVGVSSANLDIVKQGMQLAVTEPQGTGCCLIKAQVPVSVAAKSGTAETVVHNDPTVPAALQSKPDAWFEAFAPAQNPQIAIVVLIEHAGEGAQFAAPPVRESLVWYFTQGPGAGKNQ